MVYGADPQILFDKASGKYYCYATDEARYYENNFVIYESDDLKTWTLVGPTFKEDEPKWGKDWYWAPECYYNEHNGYFYLLYSARVKDEYEDEFFHEKGYEESCRMGIAVSKSPKGSFVNLPGGPMDYHPYDDEIPLLEKITDNPFVGIDEKKYNSAPKGAYASMIDVHLLEDEGRLFLYFSRCCYRHGLFDKRLNKVIEESNICAVELDMHSWNVKEPEKLRVTRQYQRTVDGQRRDLFVKLLTHDMDPQQWENGTVNDYDKGIGQKRNRRWLEGPSVWWFRENGKKVYAITYSSNYFCHELYGVGIAFGPGPFGPFKKYPGNPIISKETDKRYCSTGHGCPITDEDGNLYYFHHGRIGDSRRCLFLTKIKKLSTNDVTVADMVAAQEK